jgi:hypothetical protein
MCDVVIYKKRWYTDDTPHYFATRQALEASGIQYRISTGRFVPARIAIFFTGRKHAFVDRAMDQQNSMGNVWIVVEGGFIRRVMTKRGPRPWSDIENFYFGVGWKGIGGKAYFLNDNMPSDRFDDLNVGIKPWRIKQDGPVVLCGRVPKDKLIQVRDEILSKTDRQVIYRPHPASPDTCPDLPTDNSSLEEMLSKAYAVAGYGSTILVDAAMEGVPIFLLDGNSVARPIANTSLDTLHSPKLPKRHQWLCNLAYAQWNVNEIAQGLAFKHLRLREVLCGLRIRDLKEKF